MRLECVLYTSSARLPATEEHRRQALTSILASARRHNQANAVTGYLALIDDVFVQIVEGEDLTLNGIMLRISYDYRHTDMQVLARGQLDKRRFSGWSMGCSIDETTLAAACAVAGLNNGASVRLAGAECLTDFLRALAGEASRRGSELAA